MPHNIQTHLLCDVEVEDDWLVEVDIDVEVDMEVLRWGRLGVGHRETLLC